MMSILVDVSPYSFGISYLGERDGVSYPHGYKSIIRAQHGVADHQHERFYTTYPVPGESRNPRL